MLAVKIDHHTAFRNEHLQKYVGRTIVVVQAPNENINIVDRWIDKPLKVVQSNKSQSVYLKDESITNDNSFDTMCPEMPIRFAVID